jgi:hypothetical protein
MADDNTDPNASGDEGNQDQNDNVNDGAGDGAASGDDKPVSREEFNKLFEKMRNADRRATAAEKAANEKQKALDAIETAKLGDVEKAKKEAADAAAERDRTAAELKKTRLESAFIKASNGISWHDIDTAYEALLKHYNDGVEIDDNGTVKGMTDAVKKLAKEKAFLVNVSGVQPAAGATGGSHNGRKGDDADVKAARQKELAARMPNAFRPR